MLYDTHVGIPEIIIIAIVLSMDSFAVSVTLGLSAGQLKINQIFMPGIYFGFFQAIMPLIGYFAGTILAGIISSLDHWVAFTLLGFIGVKMIKESFSRNKGKTGEISFKAGKMLLLSIATSIDAFIVGITFSFLKVDIVSSILIIGVTTFMISTGGVIIGNIFGLKFKSRAELAGGIILILLGIKILIEHLYG